MLVCHCHRVNDTRISEVLAAGADGIRGVVRATRAGSGCGGCIPMLRELCTARAAEASCGLHGGVEHDEAALAG